MIEQTERWFAGTPWHEHIRARLRAAEARVA
jgi:hypothetical protein